MYLNTGHGEVVYLSFFSSSFESVHGLEIARYKARIFIFWSLFHNNNQKIKCYPRHLWCIEINGSIGLNKGIAFSDHTHLFAQLIARTAKDIEVLIDSLPSEESSAELQSASLLKLEEENREAAQRLEDIVQQVKILIGFNSQY